MSSSLLHRVQNVHAAARRLICLYGLARFAVAGIVASVALCLIDYLLRIHDPVARWLICALFLGLISASFRKFVLPVLWLKRDPIATARRTELHFPEPGERLSSAIAFLRQSENDRTAGSPDLRR